MRSLDGMGGPARATGPDVGHVGPRGWGLVAGALLWSAGCAPAEGPAAPGQDALSDSAYAALVSRISEPSGFFDTDNLISNESGYLKVVGALKRSGVHGGAYVGVGPDQNYSYIAALRPDIAFMVDIRRDNLLHHLLLRALMEASPTRVGFLCALTGRAPPPDTARWSGRTIDDIVAWVDQAPFDDVVADGVHRRVAAAVSSFGIPLSPEDLATVRRFHQSFMDAGLSLRFNTLGRPPRPYYPTYRQLIVETDADGDQASYLASAEDYAWVRDMQLAGRIVPVVGDLAGDHAVVELGRVLAEMEIPLRAFYTSNVEFYLWQGGTFARWQANLASLPAAPEAVVIRSYFPNFGSPHPSSMPGYYSTQILQPVAVTTGTGFASYWDVVTRGVLELR